jgi:hypothetical protein
MPPKQWERDLAENREALEDFTRDAVSKAGLETEAKLQDLRTEVGELRSEMMEALAGLKLMMQSTMDAVKEVASPSKEVPAGTSLTQEALEGTSLTKDTPDGVSVSAGNGGDPASGSVFDIEPRATTETSERYDHRLLDSIRVLYRANLEDETQEEFRHRARLRHAIDVVRRESEAMRGLPSPRGPSPSIRDQRTAGAATPDRPSIRRSRTAPFVRYGTVVPEDKAQALSEHSWESRMQDTLRRMIRERVGEEPPSNMPRDHLRALRLPMPTPLYEGEDDLLLFQQWLLGLLRWLSTYMLHQVL